MAKLALTRLRAGLSRTTRLAVVLMMLFVAVSVPISIVALTELEKPVKQEATLPLELRPDYKAGFEAGARLVQYHYDTRNAMLQKGGACTLAKLAGCK